MAHAPMPPHAPGLAALDVHGSMNRGDIAKFHRYLDVLKECAILSFCCRTYNMFECFAVNKDWGVVWSAVVIQGVGISSAVEITSNMAFYSTEH
eukprot:7315492-Ditylum_brightwellii.AAC.1